MLRVYCDEDGLYIIEPISRGAIFPVSPKRPYQSLPEPIRNKISLLMCAGIGVPIKCIGKMISHYEFNLEERHAGEIDDETTDDENRDRPLTLPSDLMQW